MKKFFGLQICKQESSKKIKYKKFKNFYILTWRLGYDKHLPAGGKIVVVEISDIWIRNNFNLDLSIHIDLC